MRTIAWQTRPVFISSTFRDMHAERDHLHNFVFPALEERLRERYHHLEPIDLRWGVETTGVDEQQAKEMLVLKVCLNEIERSRPFLIALLGERYGWIPPEERMTVAAREAGYAHDLAGRSVTALEIEYGVLNSTDQLKRSFFYFRDPLPCHAMDPATAAIYSDQFSLDPEGEQAHQRLIDLKARIEREHLERVRHYTANWDHEKCCATGLEEWGRQVLDDLWNELDAETAQLAHSATTWEELERRSLEAFMENRSRDFTGREELIVTLKKLATSEAIIGADWGASITGPAGIGKSSLMARLAAILRNSDHILLFASAGTSPDSIRIDQMLRRWVEELATHIGIKNTLTEKTTAEELEQSFHQMLGQAAAKKRVIILIDALNQFENSPQAKYLTWLPKRLPINSRLIATAIPGDASAALEGKYGVINIPLLPLAQNEAERIISAICSRYHRELNPKITTILLEKTNKSSNFACGNPLWLTMALEELNLLDADDFARADRQYDGTGEEKLLNLLVDTARQLPGDVDDLYGWLLARAEDVHGKEWAQAFVNLIAVSRSGWRESDLKVLMSTMSCRSWSDLDFAALRRGFRAHVSQRGRFGQWDFSHAQMRIAAQERNLAEETVLKLLHANIANHLLDLPQDDPLHQSETMVHLIWADDQQSAAQYYGSELNDGEEQGATSALAEFLTSSEHEEDVREIGWVCGLLDATKGNERQIFLICSNFAFNLNYALRHKRRLRLRLILLEDTATFLLDSNIIQIEGLTVLISVISQKIGEISLTLGDTDKCRAVYNLSLEISNKMSTLEPDNSDYLRVLSFSLNNMGDLESRRDPAAARQWYLKGLEIAEKLYALDPENTDYLRDLVDSFNKMGDLDGRRDPAVARQWYLKGLEIAEKLASLESDNIEYTRALLIYYNNMGNLYDQRDPETARQWYLKGLEIAEKLYALDPENTDYLRDLVGSFINMGDLDDRRDPAAARQWYLKGLEIAENL
jgi:tetratricopeptide (TPR) repeat protein